MDWDLLVGIIITIASIGVSTALIVGCLRIINRISSRNLSTLREIEKEFRRGR